MRVKEKVLIQKDWRVLSEEVGLVTIHARVDGYGSEYLSVTTDNGADRETILKVAPELELLVKTHLRSYPDGLTLHVIPNTSYFLEMHFGFVKAEPRDRPLEFCRSNLWWDGPDFDQEFDKLLKKAKRIVELGRGKETEGAVRLRLREMVAEFVDAHLDDYRRTMDKAVKLIETWEPPPMPDKFYPRDEDLVRLDGAVVLVQSVHESGWEGLFDVDLGYHRYYIAESSEQAGKAAREYWEDMANSDSTEFTEIVGSDTLIQWGLGRSAGPGSSKVSSLDEWLDLWLTTPEEQWAFYDSKEVTMEVSAHLADEWGIPNPDDEDWVEVVAYRQ